MEGNRIVACTGISDVGAATTVDDICPSAAGDDIRARGAYDIDQLRRGQAGSINVLEVGDRRKIARGLIRRRQIDRRRRTHHQRIRSGPAVDRDFGTPIVDGVVARGGIDDVGPASAMDDVVARTGGDRVGAG